MVEQYERLPEWLRWILFPPLSVLFMFFAILFMAVVRIDFAVIHSTIAIVSLAIAVHILAPRWKKLVISTKSEQVLGPRVSTQREE